MCSSNKSCPIEYAADIILASDKLAYDAATAAGDGKSANRGTYCPPDKEVLMKQLDLLPPAKIYRFLHFVMMRSAEGLHPEFVAGRFNKQNSCDQL